MVKRFQPAWFLRASMGKPDFDAQNPQVKPDLPTIKKPQTEQKAVTPQLDKKEKPETDTQKPPQEIKPEIKEIPKIDGKININNAALEELDKLPGIGPVKAKSIIDYREKYGKFDSIEEITNIRGIGDKTFENLKDSITVGE